MSRSIPGVDHFRIDKFINGKVKSCFECREKKRKCSRDYPSCTYCTKQNISCVYMSNDPGAIEKHARLLMDLKCSNTPEKTIPDLSSPASSSSSPDKKKSDKSSAKPSPITHITTPSITNITTPSITNITTPSITNITTPSEFSSKPSPETATSEKIIPIEVVNNEKSSSSSDTNVNTPSHPKIRYKNTSKKHFKKEKIDNLKQQTEDLKSLRPHVHEPCAHAPKPINNSDRRATHGMLFSRPELRVGTAFTKILNSSLNLQNKETLVDLDLLCSFIPNRLESDILMDRYRSSVHPIIPILDWQSFFPLYEKFWNDKEKVDLSFYITLFTIFYASSVSLYEETCINFNTANKDELIKNMKYFVGAAEISLSMDNFPHNISIVGLQASTILYTIVRNDCRTDDYISISSLVRYSQLIELNRDPLTYHKLTNTKEIQIRRLLWWQIFYLDCSTSLSTRLPPLIQQGEYDTQLPNEFKQYFNGQYKLDQSITFANGRFRWIETCNKIVKASFNVKPLSEQELLRLTRDIENLSFCCASLIQRMLDPINIMPSEEQFVKFASSVLSTLADRCYILLEILFSSQKREIPTTEISVQHEPGTYFNRSVDTSSISNSEIIFLKEEIYEKQIHLLCEYLNYGSMPRNAVFVWEVRKFQPIQTLLSLLRGLIYDIYEKKIAISNSKIIKRVEIMDTAFSKLTYLSEHTTQLCQQRWKMLKTLKELTWDTLFPNTKFSTNPPPPENTSVSKSITYDLNTNPSFITDKDWDEIYNELADIQGIIDENINLKAWDDASGHFV